MKHIIPCNVGGSSNQLKVLRAKTEEPILPQVCNIKSFPEFPACCPFPTVFELKNTTTITWILSPQPAPLILDSTATIIVRDNPLQKKSITIDTGIDISISLSIKRGRDILFCFSGAPKLIKKPKVIKNI